MAGLALAITPIDIDAAPNAPLTRLARSLGPGRIEALLDTLGCVPGPMLNAVFQDLTPSRTRAKYTLGLLRGDGEAEAIATFLRMERWLGGRPDHPAPAARQLLVELYCDNALPRGAFRLSGRAVRLSDIDVPVMTLIALRDHLVPPASARAIAAHLSAPPRETALDAGHVGVFVSRRVLGRAAEAVAAFAAEPAVLDAAKT
jgi:polyhydroxyalkanoate synthase